MADLCFVSLRSVTRWEAGYEASAANLRLAADGISRYFGRFGISVEPADLIEPDFIPTLRRKIIDAAGRPPEEVANTQTYAERSLEALLSNSTLVEALHITETVVGWLRDKAKIYRKDLTAEDWIDVLRKHGNGVLEQDEWQFKDRDVMAVRLHFKTDRPLTEAEKRTAQRAAQEALDSYWRQEQAKRKEGK